MRPLLVLFVGLPLFELWLLLRLSAWVGALPVIALVVLSAMLGAAILRRAGWRTLSMARLRMQQQAAPGPVLFDGIVLALAGLLLLLPGLLSDALGLLLLIAPLRRWLLARWAPARPPAAYSSGADVSTEVIEGEFRRES